MLCQFIMQQIRMHGWPVNSLINGLLNGTEGYRQLTDTIYFLLITTAHNLAGEYSNINIHFLPSNTTFVLQPMDQGVIKCFKTYCRRRLLSRILSAIDRGDENLKINILDAINLLYTARREVTPTTIANCFKKAGFVKDEANYQPQEQPAEIDENIWEAIQEQYAIDIPLENYVAVYESVLTSEALTDEEIVQSVKESTNMEVKKVEPEEEDEEEVCANVPENTAQCLEAITGIQAFFEASNSVPELVLEALKIIEDHALESSTARRKKQCKITDIFKKE